MAGAGLYEVGPGKTYSTIQSALDQLWTDQAGANFAATQEIRIYDDTYTEDVIINVGLRPTGDFRLKLNAASGNDAVIMVNTGGTTTLDVNLVDNVRISNLEIRNAFAGGNYAIRDLGRNNVVRRCIIDGRSVATYLVNPMIAALFVDCTFKDATNFVRFTYDSAFIRCTFIEGYVFCVYSYARFESCTFDGAYIRHYSSDVRHAAPGPLTRVVNCTFYNNAYAFYVTGASGYFGLRLFVKNCIFHTITTVFHGIPSNLHRIVSDRNCFYNCTHIAQIGGTDYDSLAAWQAFSDEEGESPDAGSIAADPKLTNPAGGDFSLQADSPCLRRAPSAGVVRDYLGNLFGDPVDIGAYSSGISTSPPVISDVSVSAMTVTVTLIAGGGSRVRARLVGKDGAKIDEQSRLGSGNIVLTSSAAGKLSVVAWSCGAGDNPIGEPSGILDCYIFAHASTSRMSKIFEPLKKILGDDVEISALVTTNNIRPSDDASEPETGAMIYYGWQSGQWNSKTRRGRGVLGISCGSVEDKVDANELLDLVRAALTARALSYSGSPVRVHAFRETDSLTDAGTTDSGRSLAATAFEVLFVEA